jgi:hypothetical protein
LCIPGDVTANTTPEETEEPVKKKKKAKQKTYE